MNLMSFSGSFLDFLSFLAFFILAITPVLEQHQIVTFPLYSVITLLILAFVGKIWIFFKKKRMTNNNNAAIEYLDLVVCVVGVICAYIYSHQLLYFWCFMLLLQGVSILPLLRRNKS